MPCITIKYESKELTINVEGFQSLLSFDNEFQVQQAVCNLCIERILLQYKVSAVSL